MVVVDDTELAEMLNDGNSKLMSMASERGELKQFISTCNAITLVPSQMDSGILEIPIDIEIGKQYSIERREAIYDKLLVDKGALDL